MIKGWLVRVADGTDILAVERAIEHMQQKKIFNLSMVQFECKNGLILPKWHSFAHPHLLVDYVFQKDIFMSFQFSTNPLIDLGFVDLNINSCQYGLIKNSLLSDKKQIQYISNNFYTSDSDLFFKDFQKWKQCQKWAVDNKLVFGEHFKNVLNKHF